MTAELALALFVGVLALIVLMVAVAADVVPRRKDAHRITHRPRRDERAG